MALWSCPKCYRHNCCCTVTDWEDVDNHVESERQKPKHEYPSSYPPGCHWAITEAWRILDSLPVNTLDISQRSFLAGMISGALMKAKGE